MTERQTKLLALLRQGVTAHDAMVQAGWPASTAAGIAPNIESYLGKITPLVEPEDIAPKGKGKPAANSAGEGA